MPGLGEERVWFWPALEGAGLGAAGPVGHDLRGDELDDLGVDAGEAAGDEEVVLESGAPLAEEVGSGLEAEA